MKKIICFIICIAVMTSLAACSTNNTNNTKTNDGDTNIVSTNNPVYPNSISFEDYDSLSKVREENPIDESFIKAMNDFSYNSASKIIKGKSENVNYSPISLYMALSLAGTGANGTTREEIFNALGVSGKDADYLSRQNGNLFRLLYRDNEIGKLRIANSLWLDKDVTFKNSFTGNGVKNFYASLYNVDFSDDKTAQLMGKWISDNTNGILSPKINLDSEQIMSIINTVYLKDQWIDKFDENATKPDSFYLKDGSKVKCDFMNMTYAAHMYTKGDGFTSASLYLKNSGSMIFILPDKGVSVDDLISIPEKTAALFDTGSQENGKVIFKLPKFSFGSDLDLGSTLNSMGIKSAFKEDADFTGITDGTAFISSVKQQTHIAVDEKGVEAAAFTEIMYAGAAPPNGKVVEMTLDRPFIFAIQSNNGAILFLGVVNNPQEKFAVIKDK